MDAVTSRISSRRRLHAHACPIRDVLDRIGDAWSLLALFTLETSPLRFNELRRRIEGISQRMLSVTLRQLERDGLVSRTVTWTKPPQVEYALTDLGRSLMGPVGALADWASLKQPLIQRHRAAYDAAAEETCNDPSA